ncbi:MAG: cytochrome c peroxidase [Calditrichia bacterium]
MNFARLKYIPTALVVLTSLAFSQGSGTIDLNSLENYADQPRPSYILKDNTPATNPLTDAGATLGRVLFYDKRLSVNNSVSCASCHHQQFAFGDPDQVSTGVNGITARHSMRLINTRFAEEKKFFWDERAASLEEQTSMPLQDHIEMGFSGTMGDPELDSLLNKMSALEYYSILFKFVYGDAAISEARIQLAMAQFIRSIESFDSRFDAGLTQTGDIDAYFPNFTKAQNSGKQLFLGTPVFNNDGERIAGGAGCALCHTPPEFDIKPGSGNNGFTRKLGGGNDFNITRAPTLRDVVKFNGASNGGLMHTGGMFSIIHVIDHYDKIEIVEGNEQIDSVLVRSGRGWNLLLSTQEVRDLFRFIATLGGTNVYFNPKWSNPFDANGDLEVIPPTTTGIEPQAPADALTFELMQNYPNPFNPSTTISYRVSQSSRVNLTVYNILGKAIATPVNGFQEAGRYSISFNAADLTAGIYFYRLTADGQQVATRKMLLSK